MISAVTQKDIEWYTFFRDIESWWEIYATLRDYSTKFNSGVGKRRENAQRLQGDELASLEFSARRLSRKITVPRSPIQPPLSVAVFQTWRPLSAYYAHNHCCPSLPTRINVDIKRGGRSFISRMVTLFERVVPIILLTISLVERRDGGISIYRRLR